MRQTFRSILAGSLTLVVCASGCGKGSTDTAAEGKPKVGIVLSSTNVSSVKELGAGFAAGAQEAGGEAVVTGPPINDPPKQSEMFKEMTGNAKSGISIQASNAELIAKQLSEAGKDGIPLLAVGTKPAQTSGVKGFVSANNFELGRQLAVEIAKKLPAGAKGTVVLGLTRPGLPTHDDRGSGIRAGLAEKLPAVRVLGPFDTQIDATANLAAWKRLVAANPKALAFLGSGANDSVNLATVRAETKGKWLAGGFDADPRALKAIKDGRMAVLASPEHFLQGSVAGWLQVRAAKDGKPLPEGWIEVPGLMITSANVDEILKRQESDAAKLAWFKPHIDKITGNLSTYTKPLDKAH